MSAKSLVVIHGVGDPVPGNTLRTIHQGLGPEFGSAYREDIVVDGVDYPRLRLGNNSIEEIVEVNWSEIRRPQKSLIGIPRHAIYLLIAMLQLSCLPLPKTNAKITFVKLYRHIYEGILFWCIYPAIVSLLLMTIGNYWQRLAISIVAVVALALLAYYLGRYDRAFLLGYIWSLMVGLFSLGFLTGVVSDTAFVRYTTLIYTAGRGICALLLFIALFEVAIKAKSHIFKDYILARLAMLYVPHAAILAIGALIWTLALHYTNAIAPNSVGYEKWGREFLSNLNYTPGVGNGIFAAGVGLVGVLTLFGVAHYAAVKNKAGQKRRAGLIAQDWLSFLLRVSPLILLSVVVALCYTFSVAEPEGGSVYDINFLRISRFSAIGVLPYLPLLVGPLATLMDILGDLLFYLLPAEARLGTARQTQAKISGVIKSLKQNKPNNKIIVLAHSQGTVIAIDALGSAAVPRCDLITLGSPIESLYQRFLANSLENRPSKQVFPENWWNLYRNDDYIAGPVNLRGVENNEIGAGGHTGYWCEPSVTAAIKKAVNR